MGHVGSHTASASGVVIAATLGCLQTSLERRDEGVRFCWKLSDKFRGRIHHAHLLISKGDEKDSVGGIGGGSRLRVPTRLTYIPTR